MFRTKRLSFLRSPHKLALSDNTCFFLAHHDRIMIDSAQDIAQIGATYQTWLWALSNCPSDRGRSSVEYTRRKLRNGDNQEDELSKPHCQEEASRLNSKRQGRELFSQDKSQVFHIHSVCTIILIEVPCSIFWIPSVPCPATLLVSRNALCSRTCHCLLLR